METIEKAEPSADVCPNCRGAGVTLPAKQKLVTDAGAFCTCQSGASRWAASEALMRETEHELSLPSTIRPPGDRSKGPLREPWRAR